jgi:hypothetical protein
LTNSLRISGRLAIVALITLAVAACAGQKRAKRPVPAERPVAGNSGPPPQVSACRDYADAMAGRQLQQDYDSIQGNFQGGSSQVFRDFAHMDAQHYYQQLYESCLSQHRTGDTEAISR